MKIYRIAQSRKFWQAPNGDIVFVDRHSSWVYQGKTYIYGEDAIDGWVRGDIAGGEILVTPPNPGQIKQLQDLAIETAQPVIYYHGNVKREIYNPSTDQ